MPNGEPVVVLFSAVASGTTATAGSDWIKLAPRGGVRTRDGREYHFHPETLLKRYNEDGVRIPIDFEHGSAHLAAKGQRNDAVGWIEAMEAREDGLYGRVEWLAAGKAALAARSYRYLSPGFGHSADGAAIYVHHVSLVNAPALANMPALASVATIEGDDTVLLTRLIEALGLKAEATEDEAIEAIKALRTPESVATASAAIQSLLIERASANASQAKKDAEAKVDGAIRSGALPPAAKDWAIATCAADPKNFETFLEKVGAPFAHLFASAFTPAQEAAVRGWEPINEKPAERDLIAAQLGIDPKRMGGR